MGYNKYNKRSLKAFFFCLMVYNKTGGSSMFNQILKKDSLLYLGIFLITMGLITIILNTKLLELFSILLSITIILLAISSIIRYFISKVKSDKKVKLSLVFVHLIFVIIISYYPYIPYYILPFLFSIYLLLVAVIQYVNYYLLKKNNVPNRIHELIRAIICLFISILFLITPVFFTSMTITITGYYFLLLGINYVIEYIFTIIPEKKISNIKNIHMTLPKFVLMFIPYQKLIKNKKIIKENILTYEKYPGKNWNLEIFIHVSDEGYGKIGHADFYFDNLLYSYGNYDFSTAKFFELFGDGVLFTTKDKEEYLSFCIKKSKKTIYGFRLFLNEKQKNKIRKNLQNLKENLIEWEPPKNGKEYAVCLKRKVNVKFYKFIKGKYKTYYTIGNSCVKLVDDIVGSNILNIKGIISPGTYYHYLEKELLKKNSNVIGYQIYNKQWKKTWRRKKEENS